MSSVASDFYIKTDYARPVFFHWLDGFIRQDIGNTEGRTFKFISDTIGPLCADKDITIARAINAGLQSSSNMDFYISNYDWIEFVNLKTNTKTYVSLDPVTWKIIISNNFIEENNFPIVIVSDTSYLNFTDVTKQLLDLFKYCIFQCGDELHAISLLTFVKDNQMYLCVVNSGEGMDKSVDSIVINQIPCYSPHFSNLICDDISNPIKLEYGLKNIIAALEFSIIYTDLQEFQDSQLIDDEDKYVIDYDKYCSELRLLEFIIANANGAPNIIFGSGKLSEFANITPKSFYYKEKYSSEFITKQTESNSKLNTGFYLVLDNKYEFATTLYKMYCSFFIDANVMLTIPREILPEIKFNVNEIRIPNTLNKSVLEKMVFQINGTALYIIPQEGGSCSWYSMYWPLLMYNIYYEPNITKYKNFVKDINETFKGIVENFFSLETFDSIFSQSVANLWMMYYDKFCNIGLLKRENLEQYTDFLFNTKFKINLQTLSVDNYSPEIKKITNETIKKYSGELVNIEKTFIGELVSVPINLSNFKNRFIELTNKLAKYSNTDKTFISNSTILFYNFFFNELEANGISSNRCFNWEFATGKIKRNICGKIRLHLHNLEKRGHKLNEYNSILSKHEIRLSQWFSYLEQVVLNPDCIQIYNFYHLATFFSQENSSRIKPLAKFMSQAFAVSNIFVEIFNLFYELKDEKILFNTNVEVAEKLNEFLQSIFVYARNEKSDDFFPTKLRDLEDFLDLKCENLYLESNYLNIYNSYDFSANTNSKRLVKTKTFEEFLEEREFFYTNPEFIYSKFSNENEEVINFDTFVRINITDIIKPSNSAHRKTLLKFFGKKYAYYSSNTSKQQELFFTLENLHLLIFGTELNQKSTFKNNELKYFLANTESLTFNAKLSQMLKTQGIVNFPQYLSNNLEEISETFINQVLKKLKQTNPRAINISNKIYIDEFYELLDLSNVKIIQSKIANTFLQFFTTSNGYPYVLVNLEAVQGKTTNIKIIVIEGNYVFKIIGTNTGDEISISNIFVNNNQVLKFSELNYPFKYSMPLTCFHLFFKTGSTINVIYFVKLFNATYAKSNFLNEIDMNNQIYEFTINENTMLYPKITGDNSLITYGNLCRNYHIRPLNIFYAKPENTKLNQLFEWTDENFLKQPFNPVPVNNVVLMNNISNVLDAHITTSKVVNIANTKLNGLVNLSDTNSAISFAKLLDKIESCRIVDTNKEKTVEYLKSLLSHVLSKQAKLVEFYAFAKFQNLFEFVNINYMELIKISNTINQLLSLIDNENLFCSQLKILRELYNSRNSNPKYNFEFLFEIISGYELLEEQQKRYLQIINNYNKSETKPDEKKFTDQITNIINYHQVGGHIYPLHHFMMGKGKSSVMTPLLTLYFSLICEKNPIIIVPEHLVPDTKSLINQYAHVFSQSRFCMVLSDTEIKNGFLNGDFINETTNAKKIFIIDEFDSLIDPTKSNFNVVKTKTVSTFKLFQFIYQVVNLLKTNNVEHITIEQVKSIESFDSFGYNDQVIGYIISEINQTYQNIRSGIFIENIHWGVDKSKFYVVPYANKDKPITNSSFSSSVLTIFLTLYYYVILGDWTISDLVINFVITNNLYSELFETKEPDENIGFYIKELCKNPQTKSKLFTRFFDEIFQSLKLPEHQLNTSFVDIINIDGIYKVGYSGTVNIDLPEFVRSDELFNPSSIVPDTDEIINVTHALVEAKTIIVNKLPEFEPNLVELYIRKVNSESVFTQYGAFIDQVGVFKNIPNIQVAQTFYEYFNKTRNVIFMSETDIKYVITSTGLENYSSANKYTNPFIYYSQGHVVGVDIKQDYLPELKGLVTVNTKSTYTNVAQSIFRLRKINLGHTIDILFISNPDEAGEFAINTSVDVYNLIKSNDEKSKANKHDLLVYQTLKSEVRKHNFKIPLKVFNDAITKNKGSDPNLSIEKSIKFLFMRFNEIYTEKIKYYYIDKIPDDNKEYFDEIFKIPNLGSDRQEKFTRLVRQINQKEKLNKLVFNIGSNCQEISRATETEKVKVKVSTLTKSIETTQYNPVSLAEVQSKFDYWQYLFTEISNPDVLARITIKINDFINCVPNISSQFNGNDFLPNKSGLVFVLINKINKLLLVPGYMAHLFYNSHVLLRVNNLHLINLNQIDQFRKNTEHIKQLRERPLIKFISSGTMDNFTNKELFMLKVIILNLINQHQNHQQIIKTVDKQIIKEYNDSLSVWSQYKYINQIIIPNNEQNPSLDPFIMSNAEYQCENNKKIYFINYEKEKETNENLCEEAKSNFFRQLQSTRDKEKYLLKIQQEKDCESNKLIYMENIRCETNKDDFVNIPNIELCRRYKVEYLDLFNELNLEEKLKISKKLDKYNIEKQSYENEIAEIEKIYDDKIKEKEQIYNLQIEEKTKEKNSNTLLKKSGSRLKPDEKAFNRDIDQRVTLIQKEIEKIQLDRYNEIREISNKKETKTKKIKVKISSVEEKILKYYNKLKEIQQLAAKIEN